MTAREIILKAINETSDENLELLVEYAASAAAEYALDPEFCLWIRNLHFNISPPPVIPEGPKTEIQDLVTQPLEIFFPQSYDYRGGPAPGSPEAEFITKLVFETTFPKRRNPIDEDIERDKKGKP